MDGGPRGAGTTSRARQTGGSRVACPPAVLAVRLSISSRTSPQIGGELPPQASTLARVDFERATTLDGSGAYPSLAA